MMGCRYSANEFSGWVLTLRRLCEVCLSMWCLSVMSRFNYNLKSPLRWLVLGHFKCLSKRLPTTRWIALSKEKHSINLNLSIKLSYQPTLASKLLQNLKPFKFTQKMVFNLYINISLLNNETLNDFYLIKIIALLLLDKVTILW